MLDKDEEVFVAPLLKNFFADVGALLEDNIVL